MDSEEEDFYYSSGGEEVGSEEEDLHYISGGDGVEDAAEDGGNKEPDYASFSRLQKHYKILKEEDIRQLQDNDISTVSSVLSVSRGVACTLLCRNNWTLSSVYDEWFAVDERHHEPVGLLAKQKSWEQVCKICYEETIYENMVSAACGHPFCADCWKTYITTSINDGPGCLTLLCPEPACKATIGLEMVDSLASADDKDKYYRYLYRSYVERNRSRKWCPAPGCDLAIEFDDVGGCEGYDVTCDCSLKFCWNCTVEENHRPVDCKTVANWIEKNSSEAENTNWILAYTKPCPKCNRAIEKNQGCNIMTCRSPCGFHFCWVCLQPWKDHANVYSCNKYQEESGSRDNKIRMNAKKYLERYTHYYERWDSNDKSRKRALDDLNRTRNEYVDTLAKVQAEPKALLQFVTEAWEQIVECRHVLKWTYAYGYYLSLENSRKMNFFEYLQGEAEVALERLHYCAEKEMDKYLHFPGEDFNEFRSKLSGLTVVTRNYFENLVRALENNLSEVESSSTNTTSKSSENQKQPSKSSEIQRPSKSSENQRPSKSSENQRPSKSSKKKKKPRKSSQNRRH